MKKPQFTKLQTAITLYDYVMDNQRIMKSIPKSDIVVLSLQSDIEQIQTHDKQKIELAYLYEHKDELRNALNEQMLFVSDKMKVFADDENDSKLFSLVNYSASEIRQFTEPKIQQESASLYDLTNQYIEKLSPYKLTPETQAEFLAIHTSFAKSIPTTEMERQSQKGITQQLKTDFENLDKTLKKLDMRVDMVRTEEPLFYTDYYNLRVARVSYSTLALQAFITDAVNEGPIPNVEVQFIKDGKTVLTKTSTKMGTFRVANLSPGVYSIVATKIGQQDLKQTITVTGDETYILELKMTPA